MVSSCEAYLWRKAEQFVARFTTIYELQLTQSILLRSNTDELIYTEHYIGINNYTSTEITVLRLYLVCLVKKM